MEVLSIFSLDVIARVIVAMLLGFTIGLEREMTNKYAGLRTNILVCLGACVFTIISIYGFPAVAISTTELGTRDTARVAAQVVTGIGFIGGGTVLRHGATVFGLTTAATLFMSASIGMACGVGRFDLAIVATVISIITLVTVRFFETNILPSSTKNLQRLKVILNCNNDFADDIYNAIIEKYSNIKEITRKTNKPEENLTKITFILDINAKNPVQVIYKDINNLNGILDISIQDFCEN